MWKLVYKLLCLLVVVDNVKTYINEPYSPYRLNSKSSYLDYQLNRFRHRVLTTEPPKTVNSWNRSYQTFNNNHDRKFYHDVRVAPVTETPNFGAHKLRHTNTRFSKMDMLLTKMESDNKKWTTENPHKRHVTVTTVKATDDDTLDYDDPDDEVDALQPVKKSEKLIQNPTNLDWRDDDVDDDDDSEDDTDDGEDETDDWQAEEATEEPTERSFTEYKWRHYGTRARVEESRRNQGIGNTNHKKEIVEAVEHAKKINVEGTCKLPRARVIRVQTAYPDAGKAYIPHCTILHRCADDTGCCRSETHTCAPKHTARVELYFYTARPGSYSVEKLAFYNHTECHCVERTEEMMSRDAEDNNDNKYPYRPGGMAVRSVTDIQPAPEPIRRCRCPELYSPQTNTDGKCRCDCNEGNRDCMRKKRGKEHFSLKDRLCILRSECGYPNCEFGLYMRSTGRCPRKQEKLDALSRITPQ
ncbi:PDGF- and VEGF-related factor 3 [Carabus blaptoides fortunei]